MGTWPLHLGTYSGHRELLLRVHYVSYRNPVERGPPYTPNSETIKTSLLCSLGTCNVLSHSTCHATSTGAHRIVAQSDIRRLAGGKKACIIKICRSTITCQYKVSVKNLQLGNKEVYTRKEKIPEIQFHWCTATTKTDVHARKCRRAGDSE